MAMEKTEEIKRWLHLAASCESHEADLKKGMSKRWEVLGGKKHQPVLYLLKSLLLESGHDDVHLVNQLVRGFDLTGMLRESNV